MHSLHPEADVKEKILRSNKIIIMTAPTDKCTNSKSTITYLETDRQYRVICVQSITCSKKKKKSSKCTIIRTRGWYSGAVVSAVA